MIYINSETVQIQMPPKHLPGVHNNINVYLAAVLICQQLHTVLQVLSLGEHNEADQFVGAILIQFVC
jgi:hypothetical protein